MPQQFGLLALNQTTTGDADIMLGQEYEVEDFDYSSTYELPGYPKLGQPLILVRRVRASETITNGQAVKWTASYEGLRVSVAGAGDIPVGIASNYLPGGTVASGSHFCIVRKGACTVVSDGGTTLAATDTIVTSTSGKIKKQTAAPADTTAAMVQVNSRVGRPLAAITNVDGTKGRAWVNCSGN